MMFVFAALLFLAAVSPAQNLSQSQIQPKSNLTTDVISPSALSLAFPLSLEPQNGYVLNQIRNTLALYPLAIDGKNLDALHLVFTADAIANYSAPINVLYGLSQIQSVLRQALAPVMSQHAYSTQVIEVEKVSRTARSVTYFTASKFEMGNRTGKVILDWIRRRDIPAALKERS